MRELLLCYGIKVRGNQVLQAEGARNIPSTVSPLSSSDSLDSSSCGIFFAVILANDLTAGEADTEVGVESPTPNPDGGANGLTVLEG
jgi:hypothetical protein